MNSKGQIWAYSLMLSIAIVVLVLSLASPLKSVVDSSMGNSTADFIGLNCSVPPSNFVHATCVITDFSLFYFIAGVLLIGIGLLTAKIIF